MDIDAEIRRMDAEGFHYTMRPGFYRRKRDGFRVRAADWPDDSVSWLLDPMPVIAPGGGYVVGTCSTATFERNHSLEMKDG